MSTAGRAPAGRSGRPRAGWSAAGRARPSRTQSVALERQPVVEDRRVVARGVRQHERAPTPGPARRGSLRSVSGSSRELLADPGAAARLAEDRAALGGVPGAGRPAAGRSSGRRPRSAAAASRTARRAGRSGARAQPSRCAELGVQRRQVDVGEVPGRRAGPGRAGAVRRLGVELQRAGRLVVAQPQPGRGAQVAWRSPRGRRSRTAPGRRPGRRANASPSAGAKPANTSEEVSAGASAKSGATGTPATSGWASSAGPASRAAASAARTSGSSSSAVTADAGHHAGRGALARRPTVAIDGEGPAAGHPVGGQRVAGPAQVGAGLPRRR